MHAARVDLRWLMACTGIMVLFPALGPSGYVLHVATLAFLYIALAQGLNAVVGLAGLLDLGYAAFFAVGAYAYALLNLTAGIPVSVGLVVGSLCAVVFAIAIGWPTIRTRGDYLALVTLGFGEMVRLVIRNWDPVTNGPRGLMNMAPPTFPHWIDERVGAYYLGLVLAVGACWLFLRLSASKTGLRLNAIRDDEDAAAAIGINPARWKLYAFGVGAAVAGAAGVFFASWQRFVSPQSFTLMESVFVLSMVVLGRMGRFWPTVGAAVLLTLLPEWLRGLEQHRMLVLGVVLVGVVIVQERWRLFARVSPVSTPLLPPVSPSSPPFVLPASAPSEVRLEVAHLSKQFGSVEILRDVSFSIRSGEVVGLVGLNGAGKSTLFACLSGAAAASGGRVTLVTGSETQRLDGKPADRRARAGVVRTHQQPRLFRTLSVWQNVSLSDPAYRKLAVWEPLHHQVGPDEATLATIAKVREAVGGPDPGADCGNLTFVEAKLVEFMRALRARPSVLLLDETCAGMAAETRNALAETIRVVALESRAAVVMVEHDLAFLRSTCDRLLVLHQGRLVADGRPGDLQLDRMIRSLYQGEGVGLGAA